MRIEFTLDCCDLDRAATFWQAAAGFDVEGRIEGRYVFLTGHGVALTLQQVAKLLRLEALGASRITTAAREEFGQKWFVLADPDGNEFCLAREQG